MTELILRVQHDGDVVHARSTCKEVAAQVGFQGSDLVCIATAVSEIARNIVVYAKRGTLTVTTIEDSRGPGIQIVATDEGPGIFDLDRALQDGFSTGGSLGLGLPGARRLMDKFDIRSQPGRGTTVVMKKWVR